MKKTINPPILVRVWLCFIAPKRWAKRLKISKAGIALTNDPSNKEERDIGWRLLALSDKLWDEEFSRYNRKTNP